MASGVHIEKVVSDIKACIQDLSQEFQETQIPVNDDNTTFHRFCVKIEYLLQHGQKEKTSLLGTRKNYWDFICRCLGSEKNCRGYDGIKFVKSLPELRTSDGKGRAFIRFCLVHQCLADTLQRCVLNTKVTGDYYYERSIMLQAEKWASFISSLYELNNIYFDLAPRGNDLDVSWPTFARKLFGVPNTWNPPSRSISVTSLNSLASQSEASFGTAMNESAISDSSQVDELLDEVSSLEVSKENLAHQVAELEQQQARDKEAMTVAGRKLEKLQEESSTIIEDLQKKCSDLQQQLLDKENNSQKQDEELKKRLSDAEALVSDYAKKMELLSIELSNQDSCSKERETVFTSKISDLEKDNADLRTKLQDMEANFSKGSSSMESLTEEMSALKERNNKLLENINSLTKEKEPLESKNASLNEKLDQVLRKLQTTEESLTFVRQTEFELRSKIEKLNMVNDGMRNLVEAVKEENSILKQQVVVMNKEVKNTHLQLESKKTQMKHLEEELTQVKVKFHESATKNVCKEKELENLRAVLKILDKNSDAQSSVPVNSTDNDKVASRISVDNTSDTMDQDSNCDISAPERLVNSDDVKLVQEYLSSIIKNYSSSISSCTNELFKDCSQYLESSFIQQEGIIDDISSCVKSFTHETHSINHRMHILQEIANIDQTLLNGEAEKEIDQSDSNKLSNSFVKPPQPPHIEGCEFLKTLFDIVYRTHSKLQNLLQIHFTLRKELYDSKELSNLLIAKVQQQERKLNGVTQELYKTRSLLANLEKAHNKLQTSRAVMRYELQEKKGLLKQLREQLETTREEWKKVQRSNDESEVEWQNLREEFQSRQKQDSQDSGLSETNEDRSTREQSPASSDDQNNSEKDVPMLPQEETNPDYVGAEGGIEEEPLATAVDSAVDYDRRFRHRAERLEFLERQCQMLYNSLLRSTMRGSDLQHRLHTLLDSGSSEVSPSSSVSIDDPSPDPVEESQLDDNSEIPSDLLLLHLESNSGDVSENTSQQAHQEANPEDHVDTSVECHPKEEETEMDFKLPEIRRRALDSIVVRLKMERAQNDELIASLRAEIDSLNASNEQLKTQVALMADEKMQKEIEMKQRATGMLKTERIMKDVQLKDVSRERIALQQRTKQLEEEVLLKEREISELIGKHQISLEEQANLQKEIAELNLKLSQETDVHNRFYANFVAQEDVIKKMREKITDQENIILNLEDLLEEIKLDSRQQQAMQWEELEKIQLTLTSREEECAALSEELKKLHIEFDEQKASNDSLQKDISANHEVIAALEMQLQELKEDSVELKKKIIKLVKEKDVLWKQNDTLHHQQRVQATDTWMDDEEVTECLQCATTFSFTVRKHHCRLCGKIFCRKCSDNWLMTTASSRRTRVCDLCCDRHIQLAKEARSPSICTNVTIDSEEDDSSLVDRSSLSGGESKSVNESEMSRLSVMDSSVLSTSSPASETTAVLAKSPGKTWSFQKLKRGLSSSTPEMAIPKHDFDIISDEEIARSLSACSPYNDFTFPNSQPEGTLQLSMTRTATDIEAAGEEGCLGEFWVNAGSSYGIPVFIDTPGISLKWEFSSDPKSIMFEVKYRAAKKKSSGGPLQTLMPPMQVQSTQATEGHVVSTKTGLYVLVFDNQYSKFMAKKINYRLLIQRTAFVTSAEETMK